MEIFGAGDFWFLSAMCNLDLGCQKLLLFYKETFTGGSDRCSVLSTDDEGAIF